MAKKYNVRLLKSKRTYSMAEISRVFHVHIRTVQSWHKSGLSPIDSNDKPLLFIGAEIKEFLLDRIEKRKITLKDGEFYCPRCRKARHSVRESIKIVYTKMSLGIDDEQVIIKGICEVCNCSLNRYGKKSSLKSGSLAKNYERDHNTLKGDLRPVVNADLFEER